MLTQVKRLIPERYKGPLIGVLTPGSDEGLEAWKGRRKVVVTLAGFYQNLGDMALTYAQKRFIEATLPGYEVLLVPSNHTYSRMKALKRVVGPDDIVTIVGGGNMDDMYSSLENARRYVVRSFPNNPIVSFPQTCSFSDTAQGRRARARSARTYRNHRDLVIFGRESRSVDLMRGAFARVPIGVAPDTVLSLGKRGSAEGRSGIMLTMRSDREGVLAPAEGAALREMIDAMTDDLLVRDTVDVTLEECRPETFEQTLHDFWDLLSSRRVVVTDRLHCMVFCVNTKTPVVVLPNSNHKIKGTYDSWLKDYSYVRYLEAFDPASVSRAVNEMWNLAPDQISGPDLSQHYEELRGALVRTAGR